MSNETARLARQLAEGANPDNLTDTAKAARERILATTDPLTMVDVEWDTKKHRLAGATTSDGDKVAMLWNDTYTDRIVTDWGAYSRDWLTPNGKRYELREVRATEEPAHPWYLETLADYENAPAGTVAAYFCSHAWTKDESGEWRQGNSWCTSREMAGIKRDVLRRGWRE